VTTRFQMVRRGLLRFPCGVTSRFLREKRRIHRSPLSLILPTWVSPVLGRGRCLLSGGFFHKARHGRGRAQKRKTSRPWKRRYAFFDYFLRQGVLPSSQPRRRREGRGVVLVTGRPQGVCQVLRRRAMQATDRVIVHLDRHPLTHHDACLNSRIARNQRLPSNKGEKEEEKSR